MCDEHPAADNPSLPVLLFSNEQKADIEKLAAVGLPPADIAAAIELPPRDGLIFVMLADMPGSPISLMLARARAIGKSAPQIKLQEAANAGNIDAAKTLQKLHRENRLQELITNMDNDEFTA
ncbi:MAG: hypothetical protein K2H98_06535 [Duncaniella sp.]|nr:hypothetical protein [Duncaniella sp.]